MAGRQTRQRPYTGFKFGLRLFEHHFSKIRVDRGLRSPVENLQRFATSFHTAPNAAKFT